MAAQSESDKQFESEEFVFARFYEYDDFDSEFSDSVTRNDNYIDN